LFLKKIYKDKFNYIVGYHPGLQSLFKFFLLELLMKLEEWYNIGTYRVHAYSGTFSTERYLGDFPPGNQSIRLVQAGTSLLNVFPSGTGALSLGDADKFRREAEESKDPDEFVEERIKLARESLDKRCKLNLM